MPSTQDSLLTRQSFKYVGSPGPSDAQLDLMLQAAVRAPDHGAVRPWRFALVRGADVPRLLDLAIAAGEAAGQPLAPQKLANNRKWLAQVPLMIAVACAPDPRGRIRELESMLSVGAAVMNMLNMAHDLGLGAYWSTGLGTYLDGVGEALGFDPLEYRFMGYVAVGTPLDAPRPKRRPDPHEFVREWQAPSA